MSLVGFLKPTLFGEISFIRACRDCRLDRVEVDSNGDSSLLYAAARGNLENGNGASTPWLIAWGENRLEIVAYFVESAGQEVNTVNPAGITGLIRDNQDRNGRTWFPDDRNSDCFGSRTIAIGILSVRTKTVRRKKIHHIRSDMGRIGKTKWELVLALLGEDISRDARN
uniref:Uncharacterized protein n=1 Tax=Globodera rostochiensis TaxID=31243 RepID=A0A914I2H6_GLORO